MEEEVGSVPPLSIIIEAMGVADPYLITVNFPLEVSASLKAY